MQQINKNLMGREEDVVRDELVKSDVNQEELILEAAGGHLRVSENKNKKQKNVLRVVVAQGLS